MRHTFAHLTEVGAGSAGLELAVLAFEDEPMRSGVAHVADPLDQSALRLDDFEGMDTACWYSHCSEFIYDWCQLRVSFSVEVRVDNRKVI